MRKCLVFSLIITLLIIVSAMLMLGCNDGAIDQSCCEDCCEVSKVPEVYDVTARVYQSPFDTTVVIDVPRSHSVGLSYWVGDNGQLMLNCPHWLNPREVDLHDDSWEIVRFELKYPHTEEVWHQLEIDFVSRKEVEDVQQGIQGDTP